MAKLINTDYELIYDGIVEQCKQKGVSVSEICRRSGIHRHQIKTWKHNNPKSIETLNKITTELNKIR
tara:strand:+ start:501 stop:701 length:201 start_codon:yes stop_codon:yes gene_type:complete